MATASSVPWAVYTDVVGYWAVRHLLTRSCAKDCMPTSSIPFPDYQGLIPWAWIEASTKGAVLLFVASEAEYYAKSFGASDFVGGISGGMAGGVAQAYATMGFCTCMKTVEITQHKIAAAGVKPPSTWATFMDIYRKEGIRGINRGVNAVAIRQTTNWGSRFGLSRLAEQGIRRLTGKEEGQRLSAVEKIASSGLGGGLSAWNQPIEVIRVEMQSKTVDPNRPKNLTVGKTLSYIYGKDGIKGLYRGVAPRIGLCVWHTICMVALGDLWVFFLSDALAFGFATSSSCSHGSLANKPSTTGRNKLLRNSQVIR